MVRRVFAKHSISTRYLLDLWHLGHLRAAHLHFLADAVQQRVDIGQKNDVTHSRSVFFIDACSCDAGVWTWRHAADMPSWRMREGAKALTCGRC